MTDEMVGARRCLEVTVGSTAALKENRANNRNDPFAVVRLGDVEYRTDSGGGAASRPVWNHRFSFLLPEDARDNPEELDVEVWDHGESGADKFIGSCKVNLTGVYHRGSMDAVQAVHRKSGKLLGHMRFHLCILVEDPSPDRETPSPPPQEKVRGAPMKAPAAKTRTAAPGPQTALRLVKTEEQEQTQAQYSEAQPQSQEGDLGGAPVSSQVAALNIEALGELWKHIQVALQQAQIQQLQKELQEQQHQHQHQQLQLQQRHEEQMQVSQNNARLQHLPHVSAHLGQQFPKAEAHQQEADAAKQHGSLEASLPLPLAALAQRLQQRSKAEQGTLPTKPQPQYQAMLPPRPVAQPWPSNQSASTAAARGPPFDGPSNSGAGPSSASRANEDQAQGSVPNFSGSETSHHQPLPFPIQMKKNLKPPPLDLSAVSANPNTQQSPNSPSALFSSPSFSCLTSPALWSPLPTPPPSLSSMFSPTSPFFKSAFSTLKPLPPLTQHFDSQTLMSKTPFESSLFSPTPEFPGASHLSSSPESHLTQEAPSSQAGNQTGAQTTPSTQICQPKAVSPKNLDLSAIAQLASALGPKSQKGSRGSGGGPAFMFPSQEVIAEALSQAFWGAKGGPQPEGGKGPDLEPPSVSKPLLNPRAEIARAQDMDALEKGHRFSSLARPTVQIPMGGKNSAFSDRRNSASPPSNANSPPSLKRMGSDELVLDFELGTPHGGSLPRETAPWAEPKRPRFAA